MLPGWEFLSLLNLGILLKALGLIMDEEKFDELKKEFEKLKEENGLLIQAFKLLRDKSDLQTSLIKELHDSQEKRWGKHDELIEEFTSKQDQQMEEMIKALAEFLEDE